MVAGMLDWEEVIFLVENIPVGVNWKFLNIGSRGVLIFEKEKQIKDCSTTGS